MADHSSPTQFEDIPLDEDRRMGRGPRMDPQICQALRMRIQSLSDQAVRMAIPDGTRPTAMKNRLLRVAAELGIPVTIRRVPGGLLFWHSTDEDLTHAKLQLERFQEVLRFYERRSLPAPLRHMANSAALLRI